MRVLITLIALTVLHSSQFERLVVYFEASNEPFKVAPVEQPTNEIPNSQFGDYCVLNNYKCPEQFYSPLLNQPYRGCDNENCIILLAESHKCF